jgi:hypothetical protein
LIKILVIIKNPPITSRGIARNWVKIANKKKSPSEIEESAENDGENFEICKKFPMADKYVGNDLGKCLNYPKIPQYWKL